MSEEGCRGRKSRLWEALPREVQWVLLADPRHVNYLSGFWVNPVSFSSGERGFLCLERDGEAVLLCDNFTLKSAIGGAFVDRTIVEPWYDHRHGVPNRDHILFRALEAKKLSDGHRRTMRELVEEHVRARGMVGRLLAAREEWLKGDKAVLGVVREMLLGLSEFYPAHIEKEDRRFFLHKGVDLIAVARAVFQNISNARKISGASTLSMPPAINRPTTCALTTAAPMKAPTWPV